MSQDKNMTVDSASQSIMNTITSYCGTCGEADCKQHYLVASYAVEGFVRLHSFSIPKTTNLPPLYPTDTCSGEVSS